MKSASGIVTPIVNVPHALSASALTTAMPSPASAMTMMKRIAIDRGDAGDRTDLGARDLRERAAAAACRRPERDEVVHRAGETHADDEPEQARRIAELRGEHRTDQRTGAGDRREMMAEEHPAVRRIVVCAVVLPVRRRDARVVERHHLGGDERAVVPVGDRQNAQDGKHDVQSMH